MSVFTGTWGRASDVQSARVGLITMLTPFRRSRSAVSTAILALFAGLWLHCPCEPRAPGAAPANDSAATRHDPHACCKTKTGLRAPSTSCCARTTLRSDSLVIFSSDTEPTLAPPTAVTIMGDPRAAFALPVASANAVDSRRPPLLVALRL